ncbi:putative metalloprotease CJM1_0395 family protein [Sagittula sp. SSi028]|uniref:putative metalloprotease CJM1_0395 family protein n=1 Tax=Sagittula sp. SSi028 TaxID=3400636 RepID=UPI003AF79E30
MQLHDSEQKSGWAALAPLMATYHAKLAEARTADAQARAKDTTVTPTDSLTPTQAEQQMIKDLAARDREVRAHEQAHMAVGGAYAGSASYTYQIGPDGKRYAIGGEVPIDVSPVAGDPEATIDKMQQVKAAALAPAEPSSADRKVAALADATRAQAQADLAALRAEERSGSVDHSA